MYQFVRDEGDNNRYIVGHRRYLLYPGLKKVGMGYYPLVNEKWGSSNKFMQKPAVTVIQILDNQLEPYTLPEGIKFVSWPPAGPFPIEQLPSTWHISYSGFSSDNIKNIDDLDIYITRNDGTPIPFTAKLDQSQGATKDTLSFYLEPSALELCQVMRSITVQVINNKDKTVLKYSFVLFSKDQQNDICLYATDPSKCPSSIPDNGRYSQDNFANNNDVISILNSNVNVLVYVAEDSNIGDSIVKLTAPRIFFQNSKVAGKFEVGVSSIIDFENPSNTDFIIDWDQKSKKIGFLSTSKSSKSVTVTVVSDDEKTSYQILPFFKGNETTPLAFSEPIIHFRETDVFNSFDYLNGQFCACAYSLQTVAEYSVGYDKYLYAPDSILVLTNNEMENQKTPKKKVKIYTSEEDINYTIFMKGEKKDYTIVAPKIGQRYYFFCSPEAEDRVNSLTIEPDQNNLQYSSINYFDLSQVKDIRKKCNIKNVAINGVPFKGFSDTNLNAFTNIVNDPTAVSFYSAPRRNLILRPEPTTDPNFEGKHVLNIKYDKDKYGTPTTSGYDPIIYTPGNYDEYYVIQPYVEGNNYKYNSYEFRPAEGAENKPVILHFYREIINFDFAPVYYNDFNGIWFNGYKNVTIHFNTKPINTKREEIDAMPKYHYDNCGIVTIIGTKDMPVIDPENPPPPAEINTSIEVKNDQPTFSFSNGNPYQTIKPNSVVVSATTVFEAKNVETPIVKVNPQSYSTINEMNITQTIEINSGSITLKNCILSDGIIVSMKKDSEWPQLSLSNTQFNPKTIDIDCGVSNGDAKLLDGSNDNTDLSAHVVVDGIEKGKCEEIDKNVNLLNNDNYQHYCLNDHQIIVSQLDASNFATPLPPTPIEENPVVDPTEKPVQSTDDNQPDDSGKSHKKKLSTGEIIGIVIGCVCGVGLIIGLIVFFVLKKNKTNEVSDNPSKSEISINAEKPESI